MTMLRWLGNLALTVALIYAAVVALMYFAQRKLMYLPDPVRSAPAAVGLVAAEEVALDTPDGERVLVWHVPPQGEKPVVIYFQGNGGGLNLRVGRFRKMIGDGLGLVAVNYRGYGGSSGSPSEGGLVIDAAATYAFAARRYPADRIVLWGESLGTGVAVALAAGRPVARVLLESPFTSAVSVAAAVYPFLPVRLLMKDQFRSDERIGQVTVPVLVLHGARDLTVPFAHGERLYAMIGAPKRFVRLDRADHNDHDEHGAYELVRDFLIHGL
jgi:fermentation-respiration switch protein FrsA (DUF1100 family)